MSAHPIQPSFSATTAKEVADLRRTTQATTVTGSDEGGRANRVRQREPRGKTPDRHMDPSRPLLLNVQEVGRQLGVSARYVRKLVARGRLAPPLKIGRASRWRYRDVETFVERLAEEQSRLRQSR